ncbi:FmdB family zinc ribbon protein [Aeromicrobium ginsengisoli]|uniref:FmdB family transcriptional regulator n=1 Tax=Aeromicrobium ginsengisoli TaxID=363867 RepID=A0A5M4FB07_9ACTN|nr:FmdB family zinc ribbon protein [Aeromicrobium ginsengisoli]KAA1394439.1 FmdB family transcriptional regulator [Aeromicrobium ginsengisoli]
MPKYQYQCKDCGEALEVQQSFTDDALTVCPNCGGDLRKVFNAVGVVFKGSGFYRNDSRSSSSSSDTAKPAAKESSSTSSSSSSDSSSSASSTPAKKSGKESAA